HVGLVRLPLLRRGAGVAGVLGPLLVFGLLGLRPTLEGLELGLDFRLEGFRLLVVLDHVGQVDQGDAGARLGEGRRGRGVAGLLCPEVATEIARQAQGQYPGGEYDCPLHGSVLPRSRWPTAAAVPLPRWVKGAAGPDRSCSVRMPLFRGMGSTRREMAG